MTLTYALTLSSADHSDATLRNSVVISYTVDVGDVWLSDYRTGEDLDGAVSAELALASRSAGHTGVVAAEQDADGIWQLVREDDAFRDGVRSVYVSGV